MAGRGMVVKYYEFCRVENKCSKDCPYWDNEATTDECTEELAKDVLTLLKEQEPETMDVCNGELYCPSCGEKLKSYYHYCNECGQAVKWDA